MRSILFCCLPFVLATRAAAQAPPACGQAALAAAPDSWDATAVVTGDFTLDGNADVAFWKREDASVMLYIAACDGERAVETWRFRIPVADGTAGESPVQVTSPLMDSQLVDRVCSSGKGDECAHMRMENQRRQSIANDGGVEIRIGMPGIRLRWSRELRGFMRIGG
jgi:hypothetical protein